MPAAAGDLAVDIDHAADVLGRARVDGFARGGRDEVEAIGRNVGILAELMIARRQVGLEISDRVEAQIGYRHLG